jgi:hypothetical protein
VRELFGDAFEIDRVVRLLQNRKSLEALKTAAAPTSLPATWKDELEQFKSKRQKYLIYVEK